MTDTIKIGVGGPVGAGKTQLIEKIVKRLAKDMSIGVITNDIYTKEDEKILVNSGVSTPMILSSGKTPEFTNIFSSSLV